MSKCFQALFTLTVLVCSASAFAVPAHLACYSLFQLRINPVEFHQMRESTLVESQELALIRGSISIAEKAYTPIAQLGQSRAVVWLSLDDNYKYVVVKETTSRNAPHFMSYEYYVAQYYAELGLPVAKIYSYAITHEKSYMTLEYIEGVRDYEVRVMFPDIQIQLRKELYDTVNRFRRARWGFIPWLIKHGLWKKLILNLQDLDTALTGDIYEKNFIFSPERNEWVLIDP